jgi:hypothetical protein
MRESDKLGKISKKTVRSKAVTNLTARSQLRKFLMWAVIPKIERMK